jgi:hypothetical protein
VAELLTIGKCQLGGYLNIQSKDRFGRNCKYAAIFSSNNINITTAATLLPHINLKHSYSQKKCFANLTKQRVEENRLHCI